MRFTGEYDLNRIDGWVSLARKANYDAKKMARLSQVSERSLRRHCRETLGRGLHECSTNSE